MKRYWPIVLWFLLSVAFAYLPFWFQRKLVFGAHVPLCIVAGISFDLILARCPAPRMRKWILAVAVAIFLPLLVSTPIYLLASERREVRSNEYNTYYISQETMDGLKFLKERSKPNEIVFATVETSRMIPAFSGNTVIWGHWAMSVDRAERNRWAANLFYQHPNWDDEQRSRDFGEPAFNIFLPKE